MKGQLLGHLSIGVEMLHEKIGKVPSCSANRSRASWKLRLKHVILSHHGSHEHGSPRVPMTPEAIALHHIDNLDAKVHTYLREIRDDRAGPSAWTPYNHSTGRRLFKGLRDGSQPVDEE